MNGSGELRLKGSTIHLNSPGSEPADVPDALAAITPNVGDPPTLSTIDPPPMYSPNPPGGSAFSIDDNDPTILA